MDVLDGFKVVLDALEIQELENDLILFSLSKTFFKVDKIIFLIYLAKLGALVKVDKLRVGDQILVSVLDESQIGQVEACEL